MKTTDLEFEYNERADGYIYVNEDKLETEVKVSAARLSFPSQSKNKSCACRSAGGNIPFCPMPPLAPVRDVRGRTVIR